MTTRNLAHVRWIAGGTGTGKSTLARTLAGRYDVAVYDGDRAEHGWRYTAERHPRMWALTRLTREQRAERTPEEMFESMGSRHGETIGFVLDDLRAMPDDRPVVVDWFGIRPRDIAPLLSWREQAVFLFPTPEFRREALAARYADPARARANWGDSDPAVALANRLGRDELWDAELRRQAAEFGLPTVTIDGSRSVDDLAEDLAHRFHLAASKTTHTVK